MVSSPALKEQARMKYDKNITALNTWKDKQHMTHLYLIRHGQASDMKANFIRTVQLR